MRDLTAEALRNTEGLPKVQREVLNILVAAHRNGRGDLTRKEIQHRIESARGYRVSDGTVCSAVSRLEDAGYVAQREERRMCEVTRRVATGLYVPQQQGRLA